MNIATARRRDSEEEESESVEQGPWKPLKKGRCVWLDVEQDIGSAGLKQLNKGKCGWLYEERDTGSA